MSLSQIIPSADQRIFIDSKQNGDWITRFVDPDTFIEQMPPLGDATITVSQSTEARQPKLSNDLILFDNDGAVRKHFAAGNETNLNFQGTTDKFTIASKFDMNGINGGSVIYLLNNDNGARNFFIKVRGDDVFEMQINGGAVYLSDGTTLLNNAVTMDLGINYINVSVDLSTTTASAIINGEEFEGLTWTGSDTNVSNNELFGRGNSDAGFRDGMTAEYFIASQSDIGIEGLRNLDAFIRDEYSAWPPYTVNGDPLPGIKVKYITADDRDFTNSSILTVETTDANGNAPPSIEPSAGQHLFVQSHYTVPSTNTPPGLTAGDTFSDIGRWIEGYPQ